MTSKVKVIEFDDVVSRHLREKIRTSQNELATTGGAQSPSHTETPHRKSPHVVPTRNPPTNLPSVNPPALQCRTHTASNPGASVDLTSLLAWRISGDIRIVSRGVVQTSHVGEGHQPPFLPFPPSYFPLSLLSFLLPLFFPKKYRPRYCG